MRSACTKLPCTARSRSWTTFLKEGTATTIHVRIEVTNTPTARRKAVTMGIYGVCQCTSNLAYLGTQQLCSMTTRTSRVVPQIASDSFMNLKRKLRLLRLVHLRCHSQTQTCHFKVRIRAGWAACRIACTGTRLQTDRAPPRPSGLNSNYVTMSQRCVEGQTCVARRGVKRH